MFCEEGSIVEREAVSGKEGIMLEKRQSAERVAFCGKEGIVWETGHYMGNQAVCDKRSGVRDVKNYVGRKAIEDTGWERRNCARTLRKERQCVYKKEGNWKKGSAWKGRKHVG